MARISKQTINNIVDRPLSQALSYFVELRKKAAGWEGLSPFAQERTPSFMVSDGKGVWKCFSSGISGKDIISFVMAKDKCDFPTAIKTIADKLSIEVTYEEETPRDKEKREHSEVLLSIISNTNEKFQTNWKRLPHNHWARTYMIEQRGFSKEILEEFAVGYAYTENHITHILKEKGLLEPAKELGIVKQDKQNPTQHYDFFRDRIMFPIYSNRNECVGFGGRKNPDAKADFSKYLNSTDSIIYHKENVLYGYTHARQQIAKLNEAILVEGYTDVIRMHQIGITNTVATCGTALSAHQVTLLKKLTNNVILFRDNDQAGQKAMLRDVNILLRQGLSVKLVVPQNTDDDPDTIGRKLKENTLEFISENTKDAVIYIIQEDYNKYLTKAREDREKFISEYEQIHGETPKLKKLTLLPQDKNLLVEKIKSLLANIESPIVRDQYIEQINTYFSIPRKEISQTDKKEEVKQHSEREKNISIAQELYSLPEELEIEIEDVIDDIVAYGLFQHNNKIYVKEGKEAPYYFNAVSNFSIEIVQHMQDEKFPMKLIRICNTYGIEKIFDVLSDKINTLQSFKNVVTSYGNFYFSGSQADHESLLKYLFDKMGNGRKIDILGWQPEGFWVWNNKVIIPGEREEYIQKEGLFKHKGESYYIPSANKNYEKNMFAYGPQKKFKSIDSDISIERYFYQMYKVHREHAITGILFGIASLYQDIIVANTNFFPMLFYYGPASTGKDNLCEAIQSMLGVPQTAIQLEGGASTIKAQIREFSQFNNGISQLSEYKRGNPQLDGVLKGLWDRRGYKRGSIESRVATDEVPILSSTILTGNDYPDAEALITRLIWEEMRKNEFSKEEEDEFSKLKDIIKDGISYISDYFINERKKFENQFIDTYRKNLKLLKDLEEFKDIPTRVMANLSVLLTTFNIYSNENIFPFNQKDIITHFANVVSNQKKKLENTSPFIKFWDCFAMSMRGNISEQLRVGKDLRMDGSIIKFNFKTAFMKIQRMWISQYQQAAPDIRKMKDVLKESSGFISDGTTTRLDKDKNPTSVFIFDLAQYKGIMEDITHQINVQLNQDTLFAIEGTDKNNPSFEDEYPEIEF